MSFDQALRLLTISTSGAVIGLSLVVFFYYTLAWVRDPTHGLLPIHVLLVTLYAILQSVVTVGIIFHLIEQDAGLTYIGPTALFAQMILIVGLVVILRYERRRYNTQSMQRFKAIHESLPNVKNRPVRKQKEK